MFLPETIDSIEILFDNRDSFSFDQCDIGEFYVDNVHAHYSKLNSGEPISLLLTADTIIISLHHSANVEATSHSVKNVFERFTTIPDIIQITLCNKTTFSSSTVRLGVPWESINSSNSKNKYQLIRFNKRGDLFICISFDDDERAEFASKDLDCEKEHQKFDYDQSDELEEQKILRFPSEQNKSHPLGK